MYDYRISKRIDELDPIPETWTPEQKSAFLNSGFIPVAGDTPQVGSEKKTKKVSIPDLISELPTGGILMMLDSASPRTSDGAFTLRKLYSTSQELVVNGSNVELPPGWYRFDSHAVVNFNGNTPLNKCCTLSFGGNLHGTYQKAYADFDFSYAHTEQLPVSGLICVNGNSSEPVDFNLSISGINDAGATGVSVTMVLSIQSIQSGT
jgi:hypothetical protein